MDPATSDGKGPLQGGDVANTESRARAHILESVIWRYLLPRSKVRCVFRLTNMSCLGRPAYLSRDDSHIIGSQDLRMSRTNYKHDGSKFLSWCALLTAKL